MLSDNKQITLMAQGKVDYTVEAFAVDFAEQGIMMAIPTPEACIYVTKQDAIDFWGLQDVKR